MDAGFSYPKLGSEEQRAMQARAAENMERARKRALEEIEFLERATGIARDEYDRIMRSGEIGEGGYYWKTFCILFERLERARRKFYGRGTFVATSDSQFKSLIATRAKARA